MEKLPSTLKLTWHKGYEKDYPKRGKIYCVMLKSKNSKKLVIDFAIFITETLNKINFNRFRTLGNSLCGDVFIHNCHDDIQIKDWAEIKKEE